MEEESAAPPGAPPSTPPSTPPSRDPSSSGLPVDRQLAKLELEISCLRNNISWLARLVPLLTLVAVLLSFLFTIYQMRLGFDNNVKISEKEFRRKFYEEQLARYLEISEVAAKLSVLEDQSKLPEESRRLRELRNGKLIIVAEDQRLLGEIDHFINVLDNKPADRQALVKAAHALAVSCRNSVVRFWQVPIPELKAD
jgi:hypothetical protein